MVFWGCIKVGTIFGFKVLEINVSIKVITIIIIFGSTSSVHATVFNVQLLHNVITADY